MMLTEEAGFGEVCGDQCLLVTLDHKTNLKSLGYICSNSQKYKIINFSFMP